MPNNVASHPFIKTTFVVPGPLYLFFAIQNVGREAAINAEITFWIEPSDFKRTVVFPLITPKQTIRFILPNPNMKEFANKYDFIKTEGRCQTINGEEMKISDSIDIKKVIGSWLEANILVNETSLNTYVGRIVDKLETIDRTIQKMLAFSNGVLVKTPEDQTREYAAMEERFKQEKG